MLGVTYLAVVVAAVAALVSTGLWYIAFGKAMAKITGTPMLKYRKNGCYGNRSLFWESM